MIKTKYFSYKLH